MVICKINKISHQILEVVPRKRLKRLLKAILITPVDKAMDKLDKSHDNKAFKKSIYSFIDEMLCPELLTEFILTVLMSDYSSTTMTLLKNMLDSPEDVKTLVEKLVSAIEDNTEEIGKIVKKVTIVSSRIIDKISEDDDDDSEDDDDDSEEDDSDSEEDDSDSEKNDCEDESDNEKSCDKEFIDSLMMLLDILDSHIFHLDDNDAKSNAGSNKEESAPESTEAPTKEISTETNETPVEEVTAEANEAPVEEVTAEANEAPVEEFTAEANEAPVEEVTVEANETPMEDIANISEDTTK